MFCSSSSRCHGLVCSEWLWYTCTSYFLYKKEAIWWPNRGILTDWQFLLRVSAPFDATFRITTYLFCENVCLCLESNIDVCGLMTLCQFICSCIVEWTDNGWCTSREKTKTKRQMSPLMRNYCQSAMCDQRRLWSAWAPIGFIQARMSKIKGHFKDF